MCDNTAADLVFTGGTVVSHDGRRRNDVAIRDGRIIAVGENLAVEGVPTVDATGLLVLPAHVDVHVHLREPGMTEKEDLDIRTRPAAAAGGPPPARIPDTAPPVPPTDRHPQALALVHRNGAP